MSSVLHYIQKRELGSRLREEKIFIREKLATDEQLYKKGINLELDFQLTVVCLGSAGSFWMCQCC